MFHLSPRPSSLSLSLSLSLCVFVSQCSSVAVAVDVLTVPCKHDLVQYRYDSVETSNKRSHYGVHV